MLQRAARHLCTPISFTAVNTLILFNYNYQKNLQHSSGPRSMSYETICDCVN